MAKKTKKSQSEKQGGGEDAKEKMSEVDKEWYQIQIKTLEEKLARRMEKLRNLELSNAEFHERYDQLREDKADVVAYLKRTLQQRTDQISELQARLEGLEQVHTSEGKRYEARLSSMDADFSRAREQLVSENMVLTKKLDALEEFRIQREQLMAKYEDQEKRVEAIKSEYEERIYELEKKHIKEEDRLKKDMMAKLESVAAEFRKASHAQMSATTQRTIRENVSVSAQVNQLSDKVSQLSEENASLQEKNAEQNRRIRMLENEENKLVKRNAYRLKVIEELSEKCHSQEDELHRLSSFYAERRKYEARIGRLEAEIDELHKTLGTTTDSTKEKDKAINDMKATLTGVAKTRDAVNTALAEASDSIRAALALQESHGLAPEEDEADSKARREDVLNQLMLLLNTASSASKAVAEPEDATKAKQRVRLSSRSPPSSVQSTAAEKVPAGAARGAEGSDEEIDYIQGSLGMVPLDD